MHVSWVRKGKVFNYLMNVSQILSPLTGLKRAGCEWVRARKLYGKRILRFSLPHLLCLAEQPITRHWTSEEKRGIDLQRLLAPKSLIHAFITLHFPSTQMSYESTLHLVPSTTLLAHCIKKFCPLGMQFSTHLSWAARNATMFFAMPSILGNSNKQFWRHLQDITVTFGRSELKMHDENGVSNEDSHIS